MGFEMELQTVAVAGRPLVDQLLLRTTPFPFLGPLPAVLSSFRKIPVRPAEISS